MELGSAKGDSGRSKRSHDAYSFLLLRGTPVVIFLTHCKRCSSRKIS
jgi:hypothetical protein